MSKVKETMRMAVVIVAALLLAALGGILVTHADGPVIWKENCPRWHEVRLLPATEKMGGVTVMCVRMAEEAPGATR